MIHTDAASALIQRDRGVRRPSPVDRGQHTLLLLLLVLTAAAWMLTIWHAPSLPPPLSSTHDGLAHHRHDFGVQDAAHLAATGMAGAGWSFSSVVAFIVAWAVMMAAMMFPGLAPMLLNVHAIARHRAGSDGAFRSTMVFVSGYLLIWTLVGGVTWALVRAFGQLGSTLGLAVHSPAAPQVLGGALIVAGLYQFTPFKQVCLDHCRSPFIQVMQRWREGYGGMLRMGLGHGLYCLGCCWALFMVLVAAGIMSLAWMLALTLIDSAEKVLPFGYRASHVEGVVFLIVGIGVASGMLALPWLV